MNTINSNAAAVEFNQVDFAYAGEKVLRDVSLAVPEKSLVAVVGPNGGGKTTLMKLTLGLLKPQCGMVKVFSGSPESNWKNIGYVPQHLSFDAQFPVNAMDVVLMGAMGRNWLGSYRKEDRKKAAEALDKVHLGHLAHRALSCLSGGERQRVLIAQALVTEPKLLILDEPTANIDSKTEQEIYDLLHKLNERMTIIVVSHNLSVVTRHASHIACVNRTVSLTPLSELTEHEMLSLYQGNMAVLQHRPCCQIIDQSASVSNSSENEEIRQ